MLSFQSVPADCERLLSGIDIREGEVVDAAAFKALIREAVALNTIPRPKHEKKAKA